MASNGSPSSRTMTTDDVVGRLGQLRIGNPTPGGLPKWPASRVQAAHYLESKPLPAPPVWAQKPPPLPPRPQHLRDRPNPYDDNAPFSHPPARSEPPMAMPDPTQYGARLPHIQLVPPVSITYQRNSQYPTFPTIPTPSLPHRFSTPGPPKHPVSPASTSRSRASSVPPPTTTTKVSSHANDESVQCSGETKTGKRCTRMIRSPHPLTIATDASPKDLERFCFQHIKDLLSPTGFYAPGNRWVVFDEWIPHYLAPDTRAALRVEMEKKPSPADEPGYIYAFELRDPIPKIPNQLRIKVGRSVHMNKRLDQWEKQCGSKEVVLRGWWPGVVVNDEDNTEPSLLKGRIKAGEKGKFSHRLERLIHLELADLMVHEQYLTPEFFVPNSKASPTVSTPMRPKKPSTAQKLIRSKCPDCGAVHREIFTFTRVDRGRLKDREWQGVVQVVIERWGKFVEKYL